MTKDVHYFRAMPYTRTVTLVEDEEEGLYFLAQVEELPSVQADGESHVEALYQLGLAFDDYIAAMLHAGREIPQPDFWPPEGAVERPAIIGRVVGAIRGLARREPVNTTPESHLFGEVEERHFDMAATG